MGTEFLISCLHEIQITIRMSTLLPLVTSTLNRIPRSPKSELIPTLTRIYEWFIKLYKIKSQILIKRPLNLISYCACECMRASVRASVCACLSDNQSALGSFPCSSLFGRQDCTDQLCCNYSCEGCQNCSFIDAAASATMSNQVRYERLLLL